MPYNPDLDEALFQKSYEYETGRLNVSVYSYNKGPKKLQITRENAGPDGELRFTKLGRMTKEEAQSILPIIQEALKSMD